MNTLLRRRLSNLLCALSCAWLLAAAPAAAQPRFDFDTTPGRLPKTVVPEHCALQLTLDPDADHFSGQVVLRLQVRQAVDTIMLHAHELKATRAQLGGRSLSVKPDATTQTWTLTPDDGKPINAGVQRLELDYEGRVRKTGSGLYQSPHRAFGKPVRMLATQLEAIDARGVFPSFDEPAFRTVFQVTVRSPKGFEVLSNMNQISSADEGLTTVHHFAPTPPMPSYLVAVAVGRFDALQGTAAGVPLRVISAPGKREQGAYALGALQQVLPYFNGYFGMPYALPKLDLLAVPSNRSGAMEDWGLISFAESTLLFDPARSSAARQRGIFSLLAHEVAHQWFGNLVTAASWEEIWLNEAFATWMAEKTTDHFNPQWQVPLRRRQAIEGAMARDASTATRAIRSGPVPEDRVFDVFDNITYDKGGAVLTMLERWIGAEPFRLGLGQYLQSRRYSNATAGDLWFHFGEASARNVGAVAASWTNQPGFPLVSISTRCEGAQTRVDLSQQRFVTGGAVFDPSQGPALWQVPVVLLHGGDLSTVLLDTAAHTLQLPGCPARPTMANPAGDGFYRVAYTPAQQAALAAQFSTLNAPAQVTLLNDTFALAQVGRLPMATYLDLLVALPGVQGPGRATLFAQARTGLDFLARALAGTSAELALFASARAVLAPAFNTVGWVPQPGEDSETEALRSDLIRQLARFNHPATIQQALALFDADEAGRAALLPATRAAVINATGRHADAARFAQLMARLKSSQSEEERWLLARALAAVPDPALARQVMELSLQPGLPNNMAPHLPGLVAEEPRHAAAAYTFVQEHWAALADKAGAFWGSRSRLLPNASRSFNQRGAAQRLLADQQRLVGTPGAAEAARVAVQIELLSDVRERESARLLAVLQELPGRLGPARADGR